MSVWVGGLAAWSVISHQTFRWEASLWSARRCYERFMKKELPAIGYFYALEANPGRPGYHVHALWADPSELHAGVQVQRSEIWQRWFKRYGRSKIEPIKSVDDVADYCSKYVCKEGAWWNVRLLRSDDTRERPLPFLGAKTGALPRGPGAGAASRVQPRRALASTAP